MKVAVLGGGDSPERDVSIRSAAAVTKALIAAGFEVLEIDLKDGLEKLNGFSGIVFPILHGRGGEDGIVQAELEKRGLPFLGSDSKSSANCFDKSITRQILASAGLPIASGGVVNKQNYKDHELFGRPHVLKVARGGSSIGTYIVRDPADIDEAKVNEVFELDNQSVIEELIEGIEVTVPVLDRGALPVIEIKPPQDKEFDYENKYNGATEEICPPVSINAEQQKQAQSLAEEVHKAMGCRHLSRTDIMINKDGSMFILEINTMPGLTDQSLYPKSAAVSGLPMPQLVTKFVDLVKADYNLVG